MKNIQLAAVLFFCSVLMYGCVASQGDTNFLYTRQSQIEGTLKKTQQEIALLRTEIRKKDDVEAINEKIFDLENKLLELEQIIGNMHAQNEKRFRKLEGGSLPEGGLLIPPRKPQPQPPAAAPETPVPEPETTPEPTAAPEADPNEKYEMGLREFEAGNYKASREFMREFLEASPESGSAQDAMFFVADSYFRERRYEESILEYQNIIDTWPSSPKIPLCQLNQGLALMEIGKPKEAGLFFESLIEAYPASPEAARAKKHLRALSELQQ